MSEKIKLLILSYYATCPPISGGALRMFAPFESMKNNSDLEVDFMHSTSDEVHATRCRKYLIENAGFNKVIGVVVPCHLQKKETAPLSISQEVWETVSREFLDAIANQVKIKKYDIIQVEHSQLAWCVPVLRLESPESKFVLSLHNVEHLIFKRWAEYLTGDELEAMRIRYMNLYAWEMMVWNWFDTILTVSPIETELVRSVCPNACVYEVPTGGGISTADYEPGNENRKRPYDMLYLGTMDWFPNAHGLLWFINEALPLVLKRQPDAKLHIVGFGNPDSKLYKSAEKHPNIKFWGQQADDKKFFHGAKVFLVPLWLGAGARVKIPTAWASKVPIVSTHIGAEGLDARNGENILLADNSKLFAEHVISLLEENELHKHLVEKAFQTVSEQYSREKCVRILKKVYHDIARGAVRQRWIED